MNQTTEFLEAFAQWQETGALDLSASVTVQMDETGPFILFIYAEAANHPAAFDAFYNITSYTQYIPPTNGTLTQVLALAGAAFESSIRTYGETLTHVTDADTMVDIYNIFAAEIASLPDGATATWVPTAVSKNTVVQGENNGGNIIGLSPVAQQLQEWFIVWTDSSQDAQIYEIAAAITEKTTAACQERGTLLPYLFMNTAGNTQDVLDSFGADNVATIKAVAAEYDPTQFFQKLQNKGYLIRDL